MQMEPMEKVDTNQDAKCLAFPTPRFPLNQQHLTLIGFIELHLI